jgi:hypothetical protein
LAVPVGLFFSTIGVDETGEKGSPMDLEQRVQALEQELQILKNQIQATLLDIREQVLNNTYPALRAEDTTVANNGSTLPLPSVPAPRPPAPVPVALPPVEMPHVRQIVLSNTPDIDEPDTEEIIRQPEFRPAVPTPRARPEIKPKENGKARQRFSELQKVALDDIRGKLPDDPTMEDTASTLPFVTDVDDIPSFITEAEWVNLEMLEEWVNKRVEKIGAKRTRALIKKYEADGRLSIKTRDVLLQLISIVGIEQTPEPVQPPPPPTREHTPPPDLTPEVKKEEEPPHNTILKLIAGVQNAGASTRRKKNG